MKKALLLALLFALFCAVASPQDAPGRGFERRSFYYGLNVNAVIEEQGRNDPPNDPWFWVNSGGYFIIENGIGRTVFGGLPEGDRWRQLYARSNPVDTENGLRPQNVFRLYTRTRWGDFVQEAYFRVRSVNLAASPQRNQSNGILFFVRGVDGNNLYYVGIRVDGDSVFKKKIGGNYEVALDQRPIFRGGKYDKDANPNLIPFDKWIGLRCVVRTIDQVKVKISLYMDETTEGERTDENADGSDDAIIWKLIAESVDNMAGGPAFIEPGFAGVRTDFMDVEMKKYRLTPFVRRSPRGR